MIHARSGASRDQADVLRRLAYSERQARSIAITSGKGGVGKTSVAVNLAIALAQRGWRVVLVDVDLGLANADVMLGLRSTRNLAHVLDGGCPIEDAIVEGPAGLRVLPGASGLEHLANLGEHQRQHLLLQFQKLEHSADFMIMDLGAGVSRNVLSFARAADHVLVVTTPEPTALADAYATVKLIVLGQRTADLETLINQARSRKEAVQAYERIAGVALRFLGVPLTLAGCVLNEDVVPLAVRARRPFLLDHPRSAASASIRALAQRYSSHLAPGQDKRGFFRRVADMFQ